MTSPDDAATSEAQAAMRDPDERGFSRFNVAAVKP
jgi:hypothetical protein